MCYCEDDQYCALVVKQGSHVPIRNCEECYDLPDYYDPIMFKMFVLYMSTLC